MGRRLLRTCPRRSWGRFSGGFQPRGVASVEQLSGPESRNPMAQPVSTEPECAQGSLRDCQEISTVPARQQQLGPLTPQSGPQVHPRGCPLSCGERKMDVIRLPRTSPHRAHLLPTRYDRAGLALSRHRRYRQRRRGSCGCGSPVPAAPISVISPLAELGRFRPYPLARATHMRYLNRMRSCKREHLAAGKLHRWLPAESWG